MILSHFLTLIAQILRVYNFLKWNPLPTVKNWSKKPASLGALKYFALVYIEANVVVLWANS